MIEVVETLYGLGVPLYAITNFSAELWPPFRATQPIFDHFRDILVSGEERLIKPDAELFPLAARRFGSASERSLFSDDPADNVTGAQGAGLRCGTGGG